MNDVLRHVAVFDLFADQAACFDIGWNAAFFRDARKFGAQRTFIIAIGDAPRSGFHGRGQHAARVASVVHHKQLVCFG